MDDNAPSDFKFSKKRFEFSPVGATQKPLVYLKAFFIPLGLVTGKHLIKSPFRGNEANRKNKNSAGWSSW